MRLRKNCAAWLGLAGACLFVIGCGGGVPDPGSDANAANGNEPGGGGGGGAPAAAPAPAVAQADAPKAQDPAAAETPAQAEAPKDQAKGQGGSTTNEMLALSGGGSNPSPPAGSEAPKAPGAPGAAPPAGGAPPAGSAPGGGALPGGGMGGMAQQGMRGQQNNQNMMADMQKRMQEQMKAQAGNAGGQKQQGGAGADNKVAAGPADVHSPVGAVKTFLDALKARDADRLSEATARRAANESSGKNQEMFGKIIEVSLSESELDDLAKKLEGYQIAGENPPKSTGRVDVVIQKSGGNGSYMRRRITARKEKKGWGVVDISPEQVFKSMGGGGGRRASKSN